MSCPRCHEWPLRHTDRYCSHCGGEVMVARITPGRVVAYAERGSEPAPCQITVTNAGVSSITPVIEGVALQAGGSVELRPGQSHSYTLKLPVVEAPERGHKVSVHDRETGHRLAEAVVLVRERPELVLDGVVRVAAGRTGEATLTIRRTGGGPLEVTSVTCDPQWVTPVTGTLTLADASPAALSLQVNAAQVRPGTYPLLVTLESPGLGPARLSGSASVLATRVLQFSQSPFHLGEVMPNRVIKEHVKITNTSGNPVTITAVDVAFKAGEPWVTPDVAPGRWPYVLEPGASFPLYFHAATGSQFDRSLQAELTVRCSGPADHAVCKIVATVVPERQYRYHVGIDFGTTNSCVAVLAPAYTDEPVPVDLEKTSAGTVKRMPTAISFTGPDSYVVGTAARERALAPGTWDQVVLRVKRDLGAGRTYQFYGETYPAEALAARIIRYMLDRAEDQVKAKIQHAVITVPTNCLFRQIEATLEACRLAGLTEVQVERVSSMNDRIAVLDEPLAAALDYLRGPVGERLNDHRLVVYDFGGGTLDVSLLHIRRESAGARERRVLQVLAGAGVPLGGEDLTDLLAEELLRRARQERSDLTVPYELPPHWAFLDAEEQLPYKENRANLAREAEQAKVELSTEELFETEVSCMDETGISFPVAVQVTRDDFEALIRSRIEGTLGLIREVLTTAELPAEEVDLVILTGQSSRIPLVWKVIRDFFPARVPVERHDTYEGLMKECVARGAFRHGWNRVHGDLGARTIGLHNRTTTSYGILVDGKFMEVIGRGESIPTHTRFLNQPIEAWMSEPMIAVVQNDGVSELPGKKFDKLREYAVQVPGASPGRIREMRVGLMLDENKELHVLVTVDGKPVHGKFVDQ